MNQNWQHYLKPLVDLTQEHFSHPVDFENNPCMIPLTQIGFILVAGPDAQTFLQGQLTCQFSQQDDHQVKLGAHCTPKGKIQNLYRIVPGNLMTSSEEPAYLLMCHQSLLSSGFAQLKKYALFSKVTLTDVSETVAAFSLYGDLNIGKLGLPDLEKLTCTSLSSEKSALMARLRSHKSRMMIIASTESAISLWESFASQFMILPPVLWDLLEIRSGIPCLYPQTQGFFFPHYLNLPTLEAVSFEKGCYIGQEVIARMQFRGKVKKHMHRFMIPSNENNPNPGDEVISVHENNRAPVGTIVRAAPTTGGFFELLVVMDDEAQNDHNLRLSSIQGPILQHLTLDFA